MLQDTFTLRISSTERRMLSELAKHHGRTQSNTIRYLVRQHWKAIRTEKAIKRSLSAEDPKREGGTHVTA